MTSMEAELVAKNIMKHLILLHGCPRIFKSDNATYFRSKVLKELTSLLDIDHRFGAPYHPESQSCVERLNGTIAEKLSMYVEKEPKSWSKQLDAVVFSYNISVRSVTKEMPFRIVFGRMPNIPIWIGLKPRPEKDTISNVQDYMREVTEESEQSHKLLIQNAQRYQSNNKLNKDRKGGVQVIYHPGDKVWVYNPSIKKGISKKLIAERWIGPYIVLKRYENDVTYQLGTNDNRRVPIIVHSNRIKPFITRELIPSIKPINDKLVHEEIPLTYLPKEDQMPLMKSIETTDVPQDNIFEAERIVNHKMNEKGEVIYNIKWKNFGNKHNSWVEENDIQDNTLIRKYEEKQKLKIRGILQAENKGSSRSWWCLIILITIIIYLTGVNSQNIIGYDCSKLSHRRIIKVNDNQDCLMPERNSLSKTQSFNASILSYSKEVTKFRLWNCHQFKAMYRCKENWLWKKKYKSSFKSQNVSELKCWEAVTDIEAGSEKYKKIRGAYILKTNDHFRCRYDGVKKTEFMHFSVSAHIGSVKGPDQRIRTSLTNLKCYHNERTCTGEDGSRIVWKSTNHNFKRFKTIGTYLVHQVEEFFMIPKLFIGGSSQTKSVDGSRIQLTNGYLIFKQTVNRTKRDEEESFMRAATAYFKSFKTNTQLAMLGGHLTKMFSLLEDHIDILYQRTCERRVQIHKLQKWILETFPHSSINLISGIEEEVIVPAGEALLVKSCKKIENLTLIFNRSIGNICYTEFPIDDNSSRFLRLPDHRIVTEGTQIDCNIKRPVFIKRGQEMLLVFENGSSVVTQFKSQEKEESVTHLENMQGVSDLFETKEDDMLLPLSLLQIISKVNLPLMELQQIHELGNGGLLAGIGRTVSAVFSAATKSSGYLIKKLGETVSNLFEGVATGSSKIVKATANGVTTLVKSTGEAVEETEEGFSHIIP